MPRSNQLSYITNFVCQIPGPLQSGAQILTASAANVNRQWTESGQVFQVSVSKRVSKGFFEALLDLVHGWGMVLWALYGYFECTHYRTDPTGCYQVQIVL